MPFPPHLPIWQGTPAGQVKPHAPQLFGSASRLKPSSTLPLQSLSKPSHTSGVGPRAGSAIVS
jgi:hypothetical protein